MKNATEEPVQGDTHRFEHQGAIGDYETAKFTADSALLRELGEHLVGKPYIALAELIKNAYDADASQCVIELRQSEIVVADNGHGMTKREFLDHWMTVGTRHKRHSKLSRDLGRRVTGSKGVGRLSAQFLASKLQLRSGTRRSPRQMRAFIDWDEAVQAQSLTQAEAQYRVEQPGDGKFPGGTSHGTVVILQGLKQAWTNDEVQELGRQIWMLNSPVHAFGRVRRGQRARDDFQIKFKSDLPGMDRTFASQIQRALENHQAIIHGRIEREGKRNHSFVRVAIGDAVFSERFDCAPDLREADWEIRVYNLAGRQAGGVSVGDMREYFSKYGGVAVFDNGFRLPYYGSENDWLTLDYDHAHRRNRSKLLPPHLHVHRALNDLPTQGRIFGVVHVNTSTEDSHATGRQGHAGESLKIQVSRDRLVGNKAFETL